MVTFVLLSKTSHMNTELWLSLCLCCSSFSFFPLIALNSCANQIQLINPNVIGANVECPSFTGFTAFVGYESLISLKR